MLRFFKWIGIGVGCLVMGIFILKFYFSYINPVASKVREKVMESGKTHKVHYISYNKIPVTFRNAIIATEDRRAKSNDSSQHHIPWKSQRYDFD